MAVAVHYTEGYDTAPAVGILVESLMDGEMSFAANLSNYYTITENYQTTKTKLNTQTVCRLFIYLDSNPSQNPTDGEGALTISNISFHKEGDPATEVDNSPAIDEITASGIGYTLKTEETDEAYTGVFRADYTAGGLSEDAYISVGIRRFTGAYGRIRIQYKSSNVSTLTVSDGKNTFSGKNEATGETVKLDGELSEASGSILVDIRGTSVLNEIRFYIDSENSGAASFELTSLELIYTPYATADWDATSKFHFEGAELGGKNQSDLRYRRRLGSSRRSRALLDPGVQPHDSHFQNERYRARQQGGGKIRRCGQFVHDACGARLQSRGFPAL